MAGTFNGEPQAIHVEQVDSVYNSQVERDNNKFGTDRPHSIVSFGGGADANN